MIIMANLPKLDKEPYTSIILSKIHESNNVLPPRVIGAEERLAVCSQKAYLEKIN